MSVRASPPSPLAGVEGAPSGAEGDGSAASAVAGAAPSPNRCQVNRPLDVSGHDGGMTGLAPQQGGRVIGCGEVLALAAERLVGVPFRLHGRDPERGLDCVGLVLAALETVGRRARVASYRLRMREVGGLLAAASEAGLVEASGPIRPGDVLLVRPGPAQHHLVIAGRDGGFVHAHAGLRRAVLTPAPLPWPEERRWRLR